ncbi:NADPH quinone reductase [Paucilactobacillus oligofermentans DSM 15707 = LMG 22743]|uniref:NADPH quinone reductase n=1 Tax=Paucilactobacillus oligofermentans DSM 15707 = LMG 22743 TaxID=1423778 RepID=A0A0R1RK66_9LACO|nr:NADP-dependent oxidoreductase [Paucilactobacillus oligofermentans]KRL55604.1 NADPH quinone reductase [Paucilactobacillus oligofermentans DSM 15707 = LMG 22743]CUS25407.1 Putative NADH(P):quinone oxidoreductase 1 [Paucilactobacillus oligofermentans DSM 15707 = LMG 22743]
MKVFGYQTFGGPEVFQEMEVDDPEITTENQVVIETLVVGLNNFERAQRAGMFGGELPIVPGRDLVGKIIKIGDNVSDFKIGDVVIAHAGPAYAEKVVTTPRHLVKKPANVTNEDAVALITPGITAYNMLTHFTQVKRGDTVLVNGASGGVGTIIVQVAKALGAYVIGVASSRNEQLLKNLGVDEIGLYDQEEVGTKFANRADVVLNAAMNGNNDALIDQAVKPDGQAATVGQSTELINKPNVKVAGVQPIAESINQLALIELAKMLAKNEIKVDIFRELPFTLQGVIDGHELLETSHAPGRIVLVR